MNLNLNNAICELVLNFNLTIGSDMNYQEILKKIYDGHLHVYGGFMWCNQGQSSDSTELDVVKPGSLFKRFPDIREISPDETVKVLLTRLQEINTAFAEDMIYFGDVARLVHESHVISLLLIVAYWGTISEEVPLTEADLGRINDESHCEINGTRSENEGSWDILLRLVREGLESKVFPDQFALENFLGIESKPQSTPTA